ncbi:MAG TPA: D,D-dipeptide ABC transporter permease, partial [Paracoccus sp. (in: a-proteobacteria)]|nr:D,D-dipeptide ABC transporter permease [Paracoccus sp. (in: a-proteobacteria)]
MTDIPTREWLLSDAPQTRAQARLGAIYQGWLTFRANKLAMLGLAILIGLVGMAI